MVGLIGTSYTDKQYYITYRVNEYLPNGSLERQALFKKNINNKTTNIMFDFPLLYLFVNLYTGDSKWCSLEEGNNLGEYWEQDPTQKPISVYPDSWI